MANTRELRRRIKSVKNTSQITKAMQMVAAAKMRKAQNQALGSRPYSETLNNALSRLTPGMDPEAHPLLRIGSGTVTGVLLLTTDKGLCGALNTNIFRALSSLRRQGSNNPSSDSELDSRLRGNDTVFYSVGKKGRNFAVKTGKKLEADFENPEVVIFRQAKQISKMLIASFLSGELKEVYVVYPHFVSTLRQEARVVRLLPIDYTPGVLSESKSGLYPGGGTDDFLFEPSSDILLDFALTHHIETQIYQALLETKASEHSARMMAMQNATDNAKELVEDLTLTYNQTRQSAITNELLEITTAQLALE